MAEREYAASIERVLAAPAPVVWAMIADTNRWDRAAGLAAGQYTFRELVPGDPSSRERVATAKQTGFEIEWIEPPYEWLEGRFVRGRRSFLKGPVRRGGFRVDLAPVENGTRVIAHANVFSEGFLGFVAGNIMRSKFRSALKRYLDALEDVLSGGDSVTAYGWSIEPPAMTVKRVLMTRKTNEVASGTSSPIHEADFQFRLRRFETMPVEPALRARLIAHIRERPDEELGQIRPFELARAWKVDRRDVLRAFLFGAKAGLVDLSWQLNCPTCRVASEYAQSLAELKGTAHCDACNIGFDLDFAQHVEAVFRVNPAIRSVDTSLYCASSPWFRPHVFSQFTAPALGTREERGPLPPGPLLFRTMRGARNATITIAEPVPAEVVIRVSDDALHVEMSGTVAPGAESLLRAINDTDHEITMSIERSGWNADVVLGSVVATFPDFLDLFATEAPASGVELSVGALTLLFTDLTGSTALYERLGDARAFALVEEHFRGMTSVISKFEGAIVKTMGDAVMATFPSAATALEAALAMVKEAERQHGHEGLTVKLGLHEGPCLAVRANDRLDFFGTTVNVAARLQAQAHGSQVVIMEELLQHADVARMLKAGGYKLTHFEANLKGIRETQRLVAIDAGTTPPP